MTDAFFNSPFLTEWRELCRGGPNTLQHLFPNAVILPNAGGDAAGVQLADSSFYFSWKGGELDRFSWRRGETIGIHVVFDHSIQLLNPPALITKDRVEVPTDDGTGRIVVCLGEKRIYSKTCGDHFEYYCTYGNSREYASPTRQTYYTNGWPILYYHCKDGKLHCEDAPAKYKWEDGKYLLEYYLFGEEAKNKYLITGKKLLPVVALLPQPIAEEVSYYVCGDERIHDYH
jgi:hypothetical protein